MTTTTISSINSTNTIPSGVVKPSLKIMLMTAPLVTLTFLGLGTFFSVVTTSTSIVASLLIYLLTGGLAVVIVLWGYLQLSNTEYIVTKNEIKITRTFLSTFSETILASKINSVQMKQNPLERILGIGSVVIKTSSGEEVILKALPNPHETAEMIQQMKES